LIDSSPEDAQHPTTVAWNWEPEEHRRASAAFRRHRHFWVRLLISGFWPALGIAMIWHIASVSDHSRVFAISCSITVLPCVTLISLVGPRILCAIEHACGLDQDRAAGVFAFGQDEMWSRYLPVPQGAAAILGDAVRGPTRGRHQSARARSGSGQGNGVFRCPDNLASIRVLGRIAMSREGLFRKASLIRGQLLDQAWYGLLREDWERPR
jgi:hypothetical protein